MLVQHVLESVAIPFLGSVPAGHPLEPIEGNDRLKVPSVLLGSGENFALRVRGDSMIKDGVRDGDILVIKRQATAEDGQTIVAVVNGEATVKRFYRAEDRVELRPANHRLKSIFLGEGGGTLEIRGIVIGLIRKF